MAIDDREMIKRLIHLNESKGEFWASDYDGLSEPKRVFRIVWELEAEVNNGGFHRDDIGAPTDF